MFNKEKSPFSPGSPVPVELFVGRKKQIEEFLRYAHQVTLGKQENVFLEGERGIGKSSLASLLRYVVEEKEQMVCVHAFMGRVDTLEEVVRSTIDQLIKTGKRAGWLDKVKSLFGKYIREVGLYGISLSFKPPLEDLREMVTQFPQVLKGIWETMKEDWKGIFIVLDDINGLIEDTKFANWYKSFADELATAYRDLPVLLTLVSVPGGRDKLTDIQPSLMRIFRVLSIDKLSDDEVREFFFKAFGEVGTEVDDEAMKLMVKYSSGLPILMHEIGDAAFYIDEDSNIDLRDAQRGIIDAAERIGVKYLDPKVYRAIRSERYKSILRKLGEPGAIKRRFHKIEIEKHLTSDEKKVFNNFLQKMQRIGVIEQDKDAGRGSYLFVNELYPVYIRLQSGRMGRER